MASNQFDLLFATFNSHKLDEVKRLFQTSNFRVLGLSDLSLPKDFSEPEETGDTFQKNAQIKVEAVQSLYEGVIVAEDSGLEVYALDGKPGINSKRWVGGSDKDRVKYLLDKLEGRTDRSARFVTVACVVINQFSDPQFFEGLLEGEITHGPRGESGFGYDPVFVPSGCTQTLSQLGEAVKNEISHRARAFEKVQDFLKLTLPQNS